MDQGISVDHYDCSLFAELKYLNPLSYYNYMGDLKFFFLNNLHSGNRSISPVIAQQDLTVKYRSNK